ncbi:DsbA family protein [Corynebacterium lubricantis]|uniref:DsbA family protein n=1 Tax=Corynebacterium lubricantis TaxID=541095 RepID=UPI00037629BF|nr:thioredoxin domain-containing protein [Corynebacterium lubricantis]
MASNKPETKTKIPTLFWAFAIVLALAAAVGGYIIGLNEGREQGQAMAAHGASVGTGTQNSSESVANEIPDVAPGTDFSTPEPNSDGHFDAQGYGAAGPVNSMDDVGNVPRRDANDPMAIGALDAPLVISELSDFGCPYCAQFATETEPELISQYVDSGLVRIEFNDLTVNGENSEAASRAARAAAEQGRFFEFKDALFADFKHEPYTLDDFVAYAEEAGVEDVEKFREDAESDKYDEAITGARDYALGLGIDGTPGFVIGTKVVSGALPLAEFEKVINEELEATQAKA